MQLNRFTDLGIRVLLLLSHEPEETFTISQLAESLKVSRNHLMKVVHFLAKQEWLITLRGKNGGVRLARALEEYPLGSTLRILEGNGNPTEQLINCSEPPCVLLPSCILGNILDEALKEFYQKLDRYTLQDMVTVPISRIIKIPVEMITKE